MVVALAATASHAGTYTEEFAGIDGNTYICTFATNGEATVQLGCVLKE